MHFNLVESGQEVQLRVDGRPVQDVLEVVEVRDWIRVGYRLMVDRSVVSGYSVLIVSFAHQVDR